MVELISDQQASDQFPANRVGAAPVPAASRRERRLISAAIILLVLLAIGLRLVPIIFVPSIAWGDEIFQATEQAHRLVYGYGLVPWEFQLGVRSWLLPAIIAGLMEIARAFGEGPDCYIAVIATAFAALGAIPVFCCFQLCRRRFGLRGALVAGTAVAIAPELVYFGARTLSEVVAGHLLVLGCYLLEPGQEAASRRRTAASGALLALVCLVRIDLAPTVAAVGLWYAWGAWRDRFVPLVVAGSLVLIAGALFDTATVGAPLPLLSRYLFWNFHYGVLESFGTRPWYYYVITMLTLWGSAIALLAFVVALGASQFPGLLVASLTTIVIHSAIGHKEYRYIYPALVMLMMLAGVGLAYVAAHGGDWLRRQGVRRTVALPGAAGVALLCWGVVAAQVWTGPALTALRFQAHDQLAAVRFVAHLPGICGVGLYGGSGRGDWASYGGYTYLHRPLPMYWPTGESELIAAAPAFDSLIYTAPPPPALGFATLHCFGAVCVAQRRGGCEARPMSPMWFPEPLRRLAPPSDKFEALPQPVRPTAAAPANGRPPK